MAVAARPIELFADETAKWTKVFKFLRPRQHEPAGWRFRARAAWGQSRHFARRPTTSGLPLETDILRAGRHVSKVPKAEVIPTRGVPKRRLCDTSRMALLSHVAAAPA